MNDRLLFGDRAAIDAAQEAGFAATMDLVCARHPYYRDLLAANGLVRGDFASLADLARLPVTGKADFMREPERFVLQGEGLPEEMRSVWDIMYTTGSTSGRPTPFVSTSYDFYNILALQRNMLRLRGVTAADVIANLFPVTRVPHGAWIRALHAAASLNIPVVSAMPGNPSPYFGLGNGLDEVVRIVERHHATILWGVPSYMNRVIERAGELGADFSAVRLVFVTGEALPEPARNALLQALSRAGAAMAAISISYGATEMQGGMVECAAGSGYHNPAPDQFRIDVVDRDTHAPLPDGEPGLVLLTHLKRSGTVLLRYALGDISARTRERCPHCGSSTERLVLLPRRADALVKIKGMLVNPDLLFEAIEAELGARVSQLVITSADAAQPLSPDVLVLRVAGEQDAALAGRLATKIKNAAGVTPAVEFVAAGELVDQSASWKTKKLLDLRQKNGG
jgi:phenylacetate-coenzyme A ligase PaaK-like adenylate-forming protein